MSKDVANAIVGTLLFSLLFLIIGYRQGVKEGYLAGKCHGEGGIVMGDTCFHIPPSK